MANSVPGRDTGKNRGVTIPRDLTRWGLQVNTSNGGIRPQKVFRTDTDVKAGSWLKPFNFFMICQPTEWNRELRGGWKESWRKVTEAKNKQRLIIRI